MYVRGLRSVFLSEHCTRIDIECEETDLLEDTSLQEKKVPTRIKGGDRSEETNRVGFH